jgi:hypothetical protein
MELTTEYTKQMKRDYIEHGAFLAWLVMNLLASELCKARLRHPDSP